jgi:four helix bundle protein
MMNDECKYQLKKLSPHEANMKNNEKKPDLRKRTKQFALRIIRMSSAYPRSEAASIINHQVLKSGTSVGAHYQEACRSRSVAEFISKMEGALQELDETQYWLELTAEGEILPLKRLVI